MSGSVVSISPAATAGLLAMSTPVGWAVAGGVVASVAVGDIF
ncbi:hypothetical protein [Actinopolyspora halophila]|nr:hypothetical protein [Actinopolyspora halophila]